MSPYFDTVMSGQMALHQKGRLIRGLPDIRQFGLKISSCCSPWRFS